ncbi:MAG: hypothetical protein IAE83_05395 [Anaerolinea sp.]|nr:hypothetical protein [Anaerolinea sp.]
MTTFSRRVIDALWLLILILLPVLTLALIGRVVDLAQQGAVRSWEIEIGRVVVSIVLWVLFLTETVRELRLRAQRRSSDHQSAAEVKQDITAVEVKQHLPGDQQP